jgi:membrane protein implicated in regulation of membrane protease activity
MQQLNAKARNLRRQRNQKGEQKRHDMLKGKKTYMTAAGGILAAVGAYFSGDMELGMMINLIVTALLAVFLRKGVKSDTGAESDNNDS